MRNDPIYKRARYLEVINGQGTAAQIDLSSNPAYVGHDKVFHEDELVAKTAINNYRLKKNKLITLLQGEVKDSNEIFKNATTISRIPKKTQHRLLKLVDLTPNEE